MKYYINNSPEDKLAEERVIFIDGEINDELANRVISQLLFLESQDSKKGITLYINSPGGSVVSGMAIIDTMRFISCDVATIGLGTVASMASLILAAGTKGKRYSLPSTRYLIHQIMSGIAQGSPFADMQICMKNTQALKEQVDNCLAQSTGKTAAQIAKDTDRDRWMSSQEAMKYGLLDHVIANREAIA